MTNKIYPRIGEEIAKNVAEFKIAKLEDLLLFSKSHANKILLTTTFKKKPKVGVL